MRRESVLLSAAGYLCSAVEDLRRGGYEVFADEIACLIAHLDAEFVLSRDDSLRDSAAP